MLDFNDTSPPGETGRRNVNDSERDEIRTELRRAFWHAVDNFKSAR